MKIKRYFLIAVVLLVLLGTFLTISLISSRRSMLDLIEVQARSLLSVVVSTQENLIFAEARLEDQFIDKLIGVCNFLESRLATGATEDIRRDFGLNSILVFDTATRKKVIGAGAPIKISDRIFSQNEPVSFEYFEFGNRQFMRFVYVMARHVYQIELPADEIAEFRTEFGINKIINIMSTNPMVDYLVLQDEEGILFATPNVQTLSRIEDDSALIQVIERRAETSRIAQFNGEQVLELIRPFLVEDELLGIFRIGISLDNYYHHVRRTEGQLIMLFLMLFAAGFVLFLLFMKYQSYANIKELFDKILGAVEDGVLLTDGKNIISGVNKMFCAQSGYDESLLVGKQYDAVFPDDPFDVHKVVNDGRKVADERLLFEKYLQYATYPLCDNRRRISGAITILHDVSKIREFEKEREEAERLVFLGNLVANFAHEIKNPLNGLSIATQRLVREFPNADEEYVRLTKGLENEIKALNKIVNDFLLLARPRMREKVPFRVASVLTRVKESIDPELHENNIRLAYDVKDDVEVCGNADDFRRAILNILLNAIEAVVVVKERPREINVSMIKKRNSVVLTIADTGIGMDKEETERIFNPYFTTKKSGTGLGLYIAQKIIKDHGGQMKVESEKNKGTTFSVTFKA